MQVLRPGNVGPDVEKWQQFLRGLKSNSFVVVNGVYDSVTASETKDFQNSKGLMADGVVGPQTLAFALQNGYPLMHDSSNDVSGPNWPSKPADSPLNVVDRVKLFGSFSFVADPTPSNPEAIKITSDWAKKNIISVTIPQIQNVPGAPHSGTIQIHAALSQQITTLFQQWESAGMMNLVLSWSGSWAPRFIRGSRTNLSNHAWGTAFDINAQWNGLGAQPALKGQRGSTRELVEIAYSNGFYWGGWFSNRPDGMHFEAYKII
jgi:hypothetical protein